MKTGIDKLIINSPYTEPTEHWLYDPAAQNFNRKTGRRPAGYIISSQAQRTHNDPGKFVEIPLVNTIRPRVREWRNHGYNGITSITRQLLEHWNSPENFDRRRFFFCQLEAIETLIWLVEAPREELIGIAIPKDVGSFQRICSKMATGTGKTLVMAMLIAWQSLNKIKFPDDERFSKDFLVVAPGLTVKSRLGVLRPQDPENYYKQFGLIPGPLLQTLSQAKVEVRNWHSLTWDSEEQIQKRKGVDKRGALSDEAYIKSVMGEIAAARNIIVINDEAHHAWRVPAESKLKGIKKDDLDQATKWIGALDRIHSSRTILKCFDFSATPFAPSGNQTAEEALFGWIVSDFGLNDAIESGLTKTPRIVVRAAGKIDPKTYKPLLYHIYANDEVKDDLNKSSAKETDPLPTLVTNAYYLLGADWLETKRKWAEVGLQIPPVMISVVNNTDTAARIKYSFDNNRIKIDELCDPSKTLHIDSSVLKNIESEDSKLSEEKDRKPLTKADHAHYLRLTVDSIGKIGYPGQSVQNVISVGMLTEGWDARTVTHIMGLRAFTSQLLCEQVVGRGLRRTSYEVDPETGLFLPEYVNVFGIPFSFLPLESDDDPSPRVDRPRVPIFPELRREEFEIKWPRISRLEHVFRQDVDISTTKIPHLTLNVADVTQIADLAPTIDGQPDFENIKTIDLENLLKSIRSQRLIFEAAQEVFMNLESGWKGDKVALINSLIVISEVFLTSGKLRIKPPSYNDDEIKRKLLIALSMRKIVQHLFQNIRMKGVEEVVPIFDELKPIGSSREAQTWYTSKPCEVFRKTHMNLCMFDSTWEKAAALEFDRNPNVKSWIKNDHLGFEIYYLFNGVLRKYIPDFLIHLANNTTLILEVKGQTTDRDKAKWAFLDEWIRAINQDGRFGKWAWAVSKDSAGADIRGIIGELIDRTDISSMRASGQ